MNSFVFYILCLRENELFFFLDVLVFHFAKSYELKGMMPNYCILQEFVVPRANQMKRFRLIQIRGNQKLPDLLKHYLCLNRPSIRGILR